MSLARAHVSVSDFRTVFHHVSNHASGLSNMQLRKTRQVQGVKMLRYINALVADRTTGIIEGMISGPGAFWHYRLFSNNRGAFVQVLVEQAPAKDAARMQEAFTREILNRVDEEKEMVTRTPRSNWTDGEFYLRRRPGGMRSTHPNARAAVAAGALDPRLVSQIASWNFEIVHP